MTPKPGANEYRRVLGHYPTGVCLVTAMADQQTPVGMIVGTFTSISLDPPLVGFFPGCESTTWPQIRATGRFTINVLNSEHEHVIRAFSSPQSSRFDTVDWTLSDRGGVFLPDAVAVIECSIDEVWDVGDHQLVSGQVDALDTPRPNLPMLFLRGGFGRFDPTPTIAATPARDIDLVDQLRFVDCALPLMEKFAAATGIECTASVIHEGQFTYLARCGRSNDGEIPSRIGWQLPFRPPVGIPLAAWAETNITQAWIDRREEGSAHEWSSILERVRIAGYSVGFSQEAHKQDWLRVTHQNSEETARANSLKVSGTDRYTQALNEASSDLDIATIAAPVLDRKGQPIAQLNLYGFQAGLSASATRQLGTELADLGREAGALTPKL